MRMSRRDFFKLAGIGLAGVLFGERRPKMMQTNDYGSMLLEMRNPDISQQRLDEIVRVFNELGKREEKYKAWVRMEDGKVNPNFLDLPFGVIQSKVLEGDLSSLVIDNLPTNYKHLMIMGQVRSTDSGTGAFIMARFNGDSGANYKVQRLSGADAVASAGFGATEAQAHIGSVAESGAASGENGFFWDFIPNYKSEDFYKSVISTEGIFTTPTGKGTALFASQWQNKAALKSITFFVSSPGNIKAGSIISVYGLQ